MAKRKRLTPPVISDTPAPLEVKSALGPDRAWSDSRAPIASVAGDASAVAALQELSDDVAAARATGRMVLSLPLDAIETQHLVRDRVVVDAGDMDTLLASLRARGQQTPIEVTDLGGGNYGLISGWRRLQALKTLRDENEGAGDSDGTVLALLRRPADAAAAYLAMVEENEIRADLSYYERARIAVKSVDLGVFDSHKAALLSLFHAASRAKRSKIRSFISIVQELDAVLAFPGAVNERTGLVLSKLLETDTDAAQKIRDALQAATPETAVAEQAVLARAMQQVSDVPKAAPAPFVRAPNEVQIDRSMKLCRTGTGLRLDGVGVTDQKYAEILAWLKRTQR